MQGGQNPDQPKSQHVMSFPHHPNSQKARSRVIRADYADIPWAIGEENCGERSPIHRPPLTSMG